MKADNELDPWEALANAIIIQAAKDYMRACRSLKKPKCSKRQEHERMKSDCLRFFHSQWYCALTEVDSDYLIRKLNEEVGI